MTLKGILYVNVKHLPYDERDRRVQEAEEALRSGLPDVQFAVMRVYDETRTHFEQLYDDHPMTLLG